MSEKTTSRKRLLGAVLGVAVVYAVVAFQEQAPSRAVANDANRDEPPAMIDVTLGSMSVGVDASGNLRPLTRREARRLVREMKKMFKPRDLSNATVRPDGSLSAISAPNVMRFTTARVSDDGDIVLDCVAGAEKTIESLLSERSAAELATARGEM